MVKLKVLPLTLVLFTFFVPVLSKAQDTSNGSGTTPTPALTPATQPTAVKAAAATEKKKPKKVWTNDDVKSMKGTVSVIGNPHKDSADYYVDKDSAGSNNDNEDARRQQLDNYKNQIQQLHSQLDAIDTRISQLKNFKGENSAPTGGISPSHGYNMVPLEDQVKQLETKKKQLQSQIEDIENEATKNGFKPGELR